jgi:Transposase DDE domain
MGCYQGTPYFSKEEFAYDLQQDLYQCPAGKLLRPKTFRAARNQILYKTEPGTCTSCSMRSQCTHNKTGRQVLRHRDERYVDRVKSYPVAPSPTRRHYANAGYGWSRCSVKLRTGMVYAPSG